MGIRQLLAPLFVICCGLCTPLAASTGPDDRPLTDPKSVVSSSNAAARPAPIDARFPESAPDASARTRTRDPVPCLPYAMPPEGR